LPSATPNTNVTTKLDRKNEKSQYARHRFDSLLLRNSSEMARPISENRITITGR
jgi:hypothetical protein